jgi:3-oxoacyl-[acyl-carrier-protein] synthase III
MTQTFMSCPVVRPGEERAVSLLLEEPARNQARDGEIHRLIADGFKSYRQFDGDILDLVSDTIREAAAIAEINPAQIDAVLFASDSYWENEIERTGQYLHGVSRFRLLKAAREGGLVNAQPFANWLSACGNVGATLALARGLVAAGQHRHAMVVSFDRIPSGTARLMGNGTSIFSDGAAAFLVSSDTQPFALLGHAGRSSARLANPNIMFGGASPALVMLETVKAINQVKIALFEQTELQPGDYNHVLMPNIRTDVAAALGGLLGVSAGQMRRKTLADHAHLHANDNLLALLALETAGAISADENLLLFNAGTWAWHLTAIRKAP